MLDYRKVDSSDQHMIDKEIRSNYSTSVKYGKEFEKVTHQVHLGHRCANCFRLAIACCCDKLEDCLELDFNLF